MNKYLTVFAIDWQNQFIYRLNFVLWRLRNVFRILLTFILWNTVFASNQNIFGYSHEQMLSYIFLVMFSQALIMSAPSNENMGGEIANGDLSNFLVKPLGYLRYWFTRDLSSKLLNIIFSIGEITLLWLIFKPTTLLPTNPISILLGLIALGMAIVTYYFICRMAISIAFWAPEYTWGFMFLVLVCMEILSGIIFPLDVLPQAWQTVFNFTPFPYLIYHPLSILIGRYDIFTSLVLLGQSAVWLAITYLLVRLVWSAGLRVYSSIGR